MYLKKIIITITILFLTACGSSGAKDKHGETTPAPENADFSNTHAYVSNGKYASVLAFCAGIKDENSSCTLETLPFIAQELAEKNDVPTTEMIMRRVVVSHDWMGKRFEEMLNILDDDIKLLLGAVTAIVIDDDIIPSYYWGLTGAMYIDPRYLWLTPEEAANIIKKDDFRSEFSNKLQFLEYAQSTINGQSAYRFFSLDQNETRSTSDITIPLASVLYHELAHANDFFPPYLRDEVILSESVLNNIISIFPQNISNKLYETYPLTSEELLAMGNVMYKGEEATSLQQSVTATNMGTLFKEDNAVTNYAYSSPFEDTATLFENAMMKLHYNVEIDYAFLEKPIKTENLICDDYIVGWGIKNRIAQEDVKRRSLFVTQKIFPNLANLENLFQNNLGTTKELQAGIDWCTATSQTKSLKKKLPIQKSFNKPNSFPLLKL